jgi:hypothetical protein
MRERLAISRDSKGVPEARVLAEHLWELVEYLSYQRATVLYRYEAGYFVVSFPRHDVAGAQQILDEWVEAEEGVPA